MKPVDCHCHLDFDQFDDDRDEVIGRAKDKLDFVVSVGCDPDRNRKTLEIAEEYEGFVKFNLGLHPTSVEYFDDLPRVKQQIRENNPAAVGEIGLDHHHVTDESVQKRQEQVFRELLELAEELGKPVNVHSRDAEQKTIDILKEYDLPDVLIHCFNGTLRQAKEAVENDMTIGVTTQVLYSSHVQSIVEELGVEDIVLETDAPFLYEGSRNEPVNVVESAEKVAELNDISKSVVIDTTTENARRIFGR